MEATIVTTANVATAPNTLAVITKAALKQIISTSGEETQQQSPEVTHGVEITLENLKDEVQQNNIEKIVETVAAAIINGQRQQQNGTIETETETKTENHNGCVEDEEEEDDDEDVEFNKNADDNSSFCDESQSIEESVCGQYKQVAIYEEDSPCNEDEKLYKYEISSSKQDTSCNFDAEMMIELIKQHPIIWDSKTKEYNTTAKRLHAWRDVSQQLGIDENICRSKWKNIRDSYKKCINRREIAIRSGARRKKPPFCRFFKELEFLHDVVSMKDSLDNISSTSQTNDERHEESGSGSGGGNSNKPLQTKTYIVCTDSGEEYVTQQIPMELETHSVDEETKHHKQSNSLSEMEQEQNQHQHTNNNIVHQVREYSTKLPTTERSESELFCASLVATFERLDRKKRQLAKIRMQQLLFELEFDDTEMNQPAET